MRAARKKQRESESLHNGFAEDFAAEIERDTWEKGQQAGRWLSRRPLLQRKGKARNGAKAAQGAGR